ncbi:MAG TPA: hypothetical protein VKB09_00515 [Thermomicrobiales bacterium]|nr:hypothetical protein [Thermomicrobiales bacterium]
MNEAERQRQIRELVEEYGLDEEDAAFAVRLAAGETEGDVKAITLPLPAAEAKRSIDLLIEHHGFTLDEATRHVAGDRTVIEAVAARRRAADENRMATGEPLMRSSTLSAD